MTTGIILANTGTPDAPTPAAVERYLRQFLSHDRIRPMPKTFWNIILERAILPRRSKASAAKYECIWTPQGSPLALIQEKLARKLEESLRQQGYDVAVLSAMSFGSPTLEDAVAKLEERGCERLVLMPLYPQYAYSNAGIAEDDLRALAARHPLADTATLVKDYWEYDAYLDAIAASLQDAGFDAASGDFLVISYHSVPRADIAKGDSYEVTTKQTTDALVERLGLVSGQYAMCYQSRFDKGRKWLDPFLTATLDVAAANTEMRRVFVVTPGFAIDCLETLYDIDNVLRSRFMSQREGRGMGGDEDAFVYVKCLNDSDGHVAACGAALVPHLS